MVLINVHKYLMGGSKADGARLFSVIPSEGMRGNGHKLKFHLSTKKPCFTVRVVEPLKRLSRDVIESPSLVTFRRCLDVALLQGHWTRQSQAIPSNLNYSVSNNILCI